jgi:SAM-dependent methyltransferase
MDANDWDQRYRESPLLWSAGPNQWVRQYTEDLAAGRALDLAAGEGRNALWLADRGWNVTAVDYSQVAIDKARKLASQQHGGAADRVHWVVDDVLSYTASTQYDLVLVIYLQLPAAQRRTALRAAAAARLPGGTMLVVGHHTDNLAHGVGGPQDAEVLYTEHDVLADVEPVREIVSLSALRRERFIPDQPRPALDVVVELERAKG